MVDANASLASGLGTASFSSHVTGTGPGGIDMANVKAWWKSDDAGTITSSGGLVSAFADKSGNGFTFTAAGTARPTTGADTINGKNVLTFDGTTDTLSVTLSQVQPFSVYLVIHPVTNINGRTTFTTSGGGLSVTSGGVVRFSMSGNNLDSSATYAAGNTYFIRTIGNGNSSQLTVGETNKIGAAGTSTLGSTFSFASGSRFQGWLAEMVIINGILSAEEDALLQVYLQNEWAVTVRGGPTGGPGGSVSAPQSSAAGTGAGNAAAASVSAKASAATGTGLAATPSESIAPVVQTGSGTGLANDATVSFETRVNPPAATGTGSVGTSSQTISSPIESSAGTGLANNGMVSFLATGRGDGTGTAFKPTISAPASGVGAATGTGTAFNPPSVVSITPATIQGTTSILTANQVRNPMPATVDLSTVIPQPDIQGLESPQPGPAATPRWVLTDPVTGASFAFDINPSSVNVEIFSKNIEYQNTLAGSGKSIIMEHGDNPGTISWSGTILQQAQYSTLEVWWNTQNPIELTDERGQTFEVYITTFSPKRIRRPEFPWYHTYDMEAMVLSSP